MWNVHQPSLAHLRVILGVQVLLGLAHVKEKKSSKKFQIARTHSNLVFAKQSQAPAPTQLAG